ncbi:MAG: HAMP domain-containing protein [Spirochaetales bacterium]|nr:HAMP domain-containing protein [Spirochaetales bacterium]
MLAFNILLVFLPTIGFLYLDTYEKQLLNSQENAMVHQGWVLSASLSQSGDGLKDKALDVLDKLQQKSDSRIRILDQKAMLLADSLNISLDETRGETIQQFLFYQGYSSDLEKPNSANWLYELVTWPVRFFRRIFGSRLPEPEVEVEEHYKAEEPHLGPEVERALQGDYGAIWRYSEGGQRSVTLFSALPIFQDKSVIGVVLISQSTSRIMQDLYEVRLGILNVFVVIFIVAIILSLFLSGTIARPLRRLRNEAEAIVDRKGRLTRQFSSTTRLDEIGDLSNSLETITLRLKKHINFIESFAADLSHEFKNPLASIRSAADIALEAQDPKERQHFLNMIQRDVGRMERLLSGAREISRIDTSLEEEEPESLEIRVLLTHLVEAFEIRFPDLNFELSFPERKAMIKASSDKIAQVFENLLDNAVSFSPPQGTVTVVMGFQEHSIVVEIRDNGPGIPVENIDKIFNRFFTYRQGAPAKSIHNGLGLSIAQAIVEGYGGEIQAGNLPKKGACFRVNFPLSQR